MATLTASELAELRRNIQREWTTVIDFDKATANAAIQALEDWYEGERPVVNTLVNTATAPKVFVAAEKKLMAKHFLKFKFGSGG
jgi:hypothetical protein